MTCYSPARCYYGKSKEKGKSNLVWRRAEAWKGETIDLRCGKCVGCRLETTRQWAMRCMNEAETTDRNCFITLTYSNENLPKDGSVRKEEWQQFIKKLRKEYGNGIRYYACGEYGESGENGENGRPHYHALLFNHDFQDKEIFKIENGNKLYTSKSLSDLWKKGYSVLGEVTFESAAYVARYVMKKVDGKLLEKYGREPEFALMSRRPGIGRSWYEKYKSDVYPSDEMIVNGKPTKPPRYYDKILKEENPGLYDAIKLDRKINGKRLTKEIVDGKIVYVDENSWHRLMVREEVKLSQIKMLRRSLNQKYE